MEIILGWVINLYLLSIQTSEVFETSDVSQTGKAAYVAFLIPLCASHVELLTHFINWFIIQTSL